MHDSGSGADFSLPYSHVSVGELLRQAGLVCSRRLEPFKCLNYICNSLKISYSNL